MLLIDRFYNLDTFETKKGNFICIRTHLKGSGVLPPFLQTWNLSIFYTRKIVIVIFFSQDLEERISHTTDPVSLKKGRKRETLENSWMLTNMDADIQF